MNRPTAWALLRRVGAAPVRLNRAVARSALSVARFLTQMGSTPAEMVFWRMGAAISAFGAAFACAAEAGTVMALLTLRLWRTAPGCIALLVHALLAWLAGHLALALVRGIREPRL